MSYPVKRGSTSFKFRIFVPDNSSTTGAGLSTLTSSSTNLAICFTRAGDNGGTEITGANIVTISTIGTYANPGTGKVGFAPVDTTKIPGLYEVQVPDNCAAFGTGDTSDSVEWNIYEKTTTALHIGPNTQRFPLTAVDPQSAATFMTGVNGITPTGDSYARIGAAGAGLTALGDTRIAHLNADIDSRMATFTLPTFFSALGISAGGHIINVDTLTTYTNNTPQTGDNYAITNSGTYGNAQLARTSATATITNQNTMLAAINAITTNTARSAPRVPDFMARPSVGSVTYTGDLYLYTLQGTSEDADTNTVIVHARNSAGTSLDAGLTSTTMTRISAGFYRLTYTVASTDTAQAVYFDFTWTVGTVAMKDGAATEVQDAENYAYLAAIRAKTDSLTFSGSNLQVDLQTIKTQTVTAASAVTFPTNIGTSTYAGADTAGTTALLVRIGSTITISGGKVAATLSATDVTGNLPTDIQTIKTQTITATGAFSFDAQIAAQGTISANLNATVGSRMASYTQPAGFLATIFGATVGTSTLTAGAAMTLTAAYDSAKTAAQQSTLAAFVSAYTVPDNADVLAFATMLEDDPSNPGKKRLTTPAVANVAGGGGGSSPEWTMEGSSTSVSK